MAVVRHEPVEPVDHEDVLEGLEGVGPQAHVQEDNVPTCCHALKITAYAIQPAVDPFEVVDSITDGLDNVGQLVFLHK